MFGLVHAISAPAWETIEFETPSAKWVNEPTWSDIPAGETLNSIFSDIPITNNSLDKATSNFQAIPEVNSSKLKSLVSSWISKSSLASNFEHYQISRAIKNVPPLTLGKEEISLTYGAISPLYHKAATEKEKSIFLEHGTIRWIADGPEADIFWRKQYKQQLKKAKHVWVTNLDLRTLEIAEDIIPGKWSAIAHPFMFDSRLPYKQNDELREQLLLETDSDFLILLPSSQNSSVHHNKGSNKALNTFIELRRQGFQVGLIAAAWGHQLQNSKDLFEKLGLSNHVKWVTPMARHNLQKMMANVDVVWDQFGMDVFGALALRTLEQGTPLISSGISDFAAGLIGSQVPWITAQNENEMLESVKALIAESSQVGRERLILNTTKKYRNWLDSYHSPQVTAELQQNVYSRIVQGDQEVGLSIPDAWAIANRNRNIV